MTSNVKRFLSQNWKWILTTSAAVFVSAWGAVQDVKGEIESNTTAIEQMDDSHTSSIDSLEVRINGIEHEVRQSNCILVAQVEGNPATRCINTGE